MKSFCPNLKWPVVRCRRMECASIVIASLGRKSGERIGNKFNEPTEFGIRIQAARRWPLACSKSGKTFWNSRLIVLAFIFRRSGEFGRRSFKTVASESEEILGHYRVMSVIVNRVRAIFSYIIFLELIF